MGEPLIQVIGESVTQPSTTPELFTPPPTRRQRPPWTVNTWLMALEIAPRNCPDALLRLQNSGHYLQAISGKSWEQREDQERFVDLFLGGYDHN